MSYWFREKTGLNFEYRFLKSFGTPAPPIFATQYHELRFGLTFR